MVKDLFLRHAYDYSKYRPHYPMEFFKWIESLVINKKSVWDVGTGNGQLAVPLSNIFDEVTA